MLRKFESLMPPFLKKLDRHLLLHRPSLWASQIHYVLFFGLLGLGLVFLTGFFPFSLNDLPSPSDRTGIFLALVFLALVFYAWRVSLFSVEKQFGQNGRKLHLRDQMIYAVVIAMALGLPVFYGWQISQKIDQRIGSAELAQDLNQLHLGEGYLQRNEVLELGEYYSFSDYYSSYGWEHELTLDHLALKKRLETGSQEQFEEWMEAYYQTLSKYSQVPVQFDLAAFFAHQGLGLAEPYAGPHNLLQARQSAQDNLYQLIKIKTGEEFILEKEFWQLFGLLIFGTWTLLLVFLQSDWKHFAGLLGILVVGGLGLALLSMVLGRVFHRSDHYITLLILMPVFLFSLSQALRKNRSRRGQIWKRLNLMLVTVGMPFVPLFMVQISQKWQNSYAYLDADTGYGLLYLGAALTFLLWNFLLHRHFVRLQAEPVRK
jgi:hypothetical protein